MDANSYFVSYTQQFYTETPRAVVYEVTFKGWYEGCPYPKTAILKQIKNFRPKNTKEIEIQFLAYSFHPNVVKPYSFNIQGADLNIIMEKLILGLDEDITLRFNTKKYYTADELSSHFCNLTHILKTLHTGQIVHRDIKPHNIRFDSYGTLKLADYGESKILDPTLAQNIHTYVGTKPYMSPMLQKRLKESKTVTNPYKDDVYQLGRTFFDMMICRLRPDDNSLSLEKRKEIMTDTCIIRNYPLKLAEIVNKMMELEGENTLTAETAYQELLNLKFENLDVYQTKYFPSGTDKANSEYSTLNLPNILNPYPDTYNQNSQTTEAARYELPQENISKINFLEYTSIDINRKPKIATIKSKIYVENGAYYEKSTPFVNIKEFCEACDGLPIENMIKLNCGHFYHLSCFNKI